VLDHGINEATPMKSALFLLLLASSFHAIAATELYAVVPAGKGVAASVVDDDVIKDVYVIEPNIRGLAFAPKEVAVKLDDTKSTLVSLRRFEPIDGFVIINDEVVPDPTLPDSALSYSWFGLAGSRQLVVAVHLGTMSATLIGDPIVNVIAESAGQHAWRSVDRRKVPTELEAALSKGFKTSSQPLAYATPKFRDYVDVLVVHTQAALNAAGSQQQLNAIVAEAFAPAFLFPIQSRMATLAC
jgi:hypothetical protein